MNRLVARIACDVRLQWRNGFYFAAAFVVAVFIILLAWVPQRSLSWILPVVLFGNLATNSFYFMAGLVLLEKAERSLEGQVVTPLRDWEYLLAKVATLCVLSLAESLVIVTVAYAASPDWFALAAGVGLLATTLACCGFLSVARYDSINEFLFPSVLVITLLALPLLDLLGVWPSMLWYLHPVHPSVVLVGAGFGPISPVELGAAILAGAGWVAIGFVLCLRGFHRFVIAREANA